MVKGALIGDDNAKIDCGDHGSAISGCKNTNPRAGTLIREFNRKESDPPLDPIREKVFKIQIRIPRV